MVDFFQARTEQAISMVFIIIFSYKKTAKKLFLKTFKKFLKRLKNTRRFNVLGRHYQVKKKEYEYSINKRKVVH